MIKPNDPAFPVNDHQQLFSGLTKREYFAAAALQGIFSSKRDLDAIQAQCSRTDERFMDRVGIISVIYADCLIAALNKFPPDDHGVPT